MVSLVEEKTAKWFGATVMSQVFAVRARSEKEVLELLNAHLGLKGTCCQLTGAFIHSHEDQYQDELNQKFGKEIQVVKVKPFSIEPY